MKATFWDHLEELRQTLIRVLFIIAGGVALAFCFYQQIHALLIAPLEERLVILSPIEGFSTMVKLSFWVGLVFSSPFWLYAIMRFILPALSPIEKRALLPFTTLSLIFAAAGGSLGYFITVPMANSFFSSFNAGLGENLWSLQFYCDYTITLLLAHVLAFELIALLFFLLHFGVVSASFLSEKRPYAIVSIFILAAILTPPDVLTQLLLGVPMTILYEGLILYGKFIERERAHDRCDLAHPKINAIHPQAK